MDFKSLKDLEKYLQKQIDEVLNKEVANAVKDEIIQTVDSEVYDAGTPLYYDRRGFSNASLGLGGRTQMNHSVNNGVLEVTDDALAENPWSNGRTLAENIEYGYGLQDKWYNEPRPFMAKAEEELKDNKRHVEVMAEGLERRGIKVEG
jgi:hypothetical protein